VETFTNRKIFYRSLRRVLAIFCLLSSLLFIPVCQRDRALDRITELGGTIQSPRSWITEKIPDEWRSPLKEHFMPCANAVFGKGWVRRLENTRTVNLRNSEVSDDDLKVIASLRSVENFVAESGNLSAEGIGYLGKMKNLKSLSLTSIDMTDGQLSTLHIFPELQSLFLSDTGISDVDLAKIIELPNLKMLELSHNDRITGSGLKRLQPTEKLTYLSLSSSGITDDSLENLKNFPNLRSLFLADTPISDDGLTHLQGLIQLSTLYLEKAQVTQEGIGKLEGLPIRILTLPKGDFDLAELKKWFPDCTPTIR
jgi:hypothetical protein